MSLFGALSSGVSGLTAQSSAMGAISDNITNVSTIGYKNTKVDFQTLVTTQTSTTFYSAGGVQSKPRQDTGVQGLLAASVSQTDLAISGQGFFVVNEASKPSINNEFLFSRAGSFFQDNDGFLRNSAGFYLQGWPTTSAGKVTPNNKELTVANQNVLSTDYLASVNLNRVGGTAAATTNIAIGANLPSNDAAGTKHKTDVQFFDTLGIAHSVSVNYEASTAENEWKINIDPPPGTTHITLEDKVLNPKVYRSVGQVQFNKKDAAGTVLRPADGSSMTIKSGPVGALVTRKYIFDSNNSVTNATAQVSTVTIATSGDVDANDVTRVVINSNNIDTTYAAGDTVATIAAKIAKAINADANVNTAVSATASAGVVTVTSKTPGTAFTVTATGTTDTDSDMTETVATTTANAGTAGEFKVDISSSSTLSTDVQALLDAIKNNDPNFTTTNARVRLSEGSSSTLIFEDDGLSAITIDPTGLQDSTGAAVTEQRKEFSVSKRDTEYTDYTQIKFGAVPAHGETIVINGTTYTFSNTATEDAAGADRNIYMNGPLDRVLKDLEYAIEANDINFSGDAVYTRASDNPNENTLVLKSLPDGSNFNVTHTLGTAPTEPDGSNAVGASIFTSTGTIQVGTDPAISFNSDGLPNAINIAELDMRNFSSGAANMDDDATAAKQISLDFGTLTEADGMTQFGSSFTPVFNSADGSQFGSFAGVTVSTAGLVTALFDNGETRPVYQIPVATFVNVNNLGNRTGNVWNSTQASGDPTLRVADNGSAGQVIQASLEQSTVDIGEEFTKMIVVQRAFSASAKIISTADEMLEELLRTKR